MAPFETIILDKDPSTHIARITFNRPEKLNAITGQMLSELGSAVDDIASDDEMRVLIITGSGRGFCAGADIGGLGSGQDGPHSPTQDADAIRRSFKAAQRVILGLHKMEKPTIAMVNGVAAGAGCDIACACDLRIGSFNSRFVSSYIRIGLFPGYGGTWLYARALGSVAKAAEFLFTGDPLEAQEAERHGLLNKLVPAERLEDTTMELAQKIASGPPIAIRLGKMLLYKGLDMDLETAMQMAAAAESITLKSADHSEGVAAFQGKRGARFKGS